jgi:hypothetical protein
MPWTICPHCLRAVMLLVAPTGQLLHVDPKPSPGGPLVVNGLAGRVIGLIPPAGRKDVGWWPHRTVCSRWLPELLPVSPLPSAPLRAPARGRDDGFAVPGNQRAISVDRWLRPGRPARARR